MSHVSDYHAALKRLHEDPLALSKQDFAIFREYGGPPEVERAMQAYIAASAPVVDRPARPAVASPTARPMTYGDFVTVMTKQIYPELAEAIVDVLKRDVFTRIIELEKRLAVVDGIAPPQPAREKPRLRLMGPWVRKLYKADEGVTHGGGLYHCVEPTFCEPSKDAPSWKQVA